MSDTNGTPRILTLDSAKRPIGKAGDFITRQQCHDMIVEECNKIHHFYLQQIPPFVFQMINDGLVHHQLIEPPPPTKPEAVPADSNAPVVSENTGGDTSEPASDATPGAG